MSRPSRLSRPLLIDCIDLGEVISVQNIEANILAQAAVDPSADQNLMFGTQNLSDFYGTVK